MDHIRNSLNWYLYQRFVRFTYEVNLSPVDSYGLLHHANMTIINLTILVNSGLVQKWQVEAKCWRISDCIIKLKLNGQNILISGILKNIKNIVIGRWEDLLGLLRKLPVDPLDLIILAFLFLF